MNTLKTKQMTVDHDKPLPISPESESVRYLGFWATPNGNIQTAKDCVYERTHQAKESIQGHPLDPKQTMTMFSAKTVGNFRYLQQSHLGNRENWTG